jgi:hypothetical protein
MVQNSLNFDDVTEIKVWYYLSPLRGRVGFITWGFGEYFEIVDIETKEFIIIHQSKIEIITKKK